ncbi:DUF2182 domain-containing protein [Labrenzia sp. 011]|uniref:DUF2182 domain-containing protein n=1 Tax=Labrenzia sp. 011 TaxID=2171494 RepID=UPI000D513AB8|nr:DUF2182 domain-containing protein [Labrenzia sp. 011]PVB61153.1 metal-binding protein [Labrenzia sp. 011]
MTRPDADGGRRKSAGPATGAQGAGNGRSGEDEVRTLARLLPGRGALALLFFAAVLTAWSALFAMQAFPPDGAFANRSGLGALLWLCSNTVAATGYGTSVLMWVLMSLAMMAPTAFPAFRTYADLTHTAAASGFSLAVLVAGYLTVWLGFSVAAALLQVRLASLGLIDPLGRSTSHLFSGALLAAAGLYQFSALKAACLKACQSPMAFFLTHWQPGSPGAYRLGLRLGSVCLGCCWALMLLAFVAGTMNLAIMAFAMVLMTLEKLPEIGAKINAPLGVFLILAGTTVIVLPFLPN